MALVMATKTARVLVNQNLNEGVGRGVECSFGFRLLCTFYRRVPPRHPGKLVEFTGDDTGITQVAFGNAGKVFRTSSQPNKLTRTLC